MRRGGEKAFRTATVKEHDEIHKTSYVRAHRMRCAGTVQVHRE